MKIEIIAADIIELGYLTLRTVGHNRHGAYVAIDDDYVNPVVRVAYFKFSDEKIHYYEGHKPSTTHQEVVDGKIANWFKNNKNFNRAAKAWNDMNLPPIVALKEIKKGTKK